MGEVNFNPDRSELLAIIGVPMSDSLLELALTHRSYAYEQGGLPSNERLEFLGDSVLGLAVTEHLYKRHPERAEGNLAKLRSSIVNMYSLFDVAQTIGTQGLGAYLLLGKGEETTGGRTKPSILADGMESLIGAVHLEHGFAISQPLILRLFADKIVLSDKLGAGLDWKTSLQELTSKKRLGVPSYEVSYTGPAHDREFEAKVNVGGKLLGVGIGTSKKTAEQAAASVAYKAIISEE